MLRRVITDAYPPMLSSSPPTGRNADGSDELVNERLNVAEGDTEVEGEKDVLLR
jgi:hypothetical protein